MKNNMNVPAHLRRFVATQNYSDYTSVDHAVWRYVMRRNVNFLGEHAHAAYLPGLQHTGIALDTVPDVHVMDEKLSALGWGAVVVDGLIPSVAFFDFQSRGLLPISVDIRSLGHIGYTPAPDIIHEAAGHAPILFDEKYAEYVKVFGEIGSKALGTKAGHDVFDAVRNLTIVLENPASTQEQVVEAQRLLDERRSVTKKESEESWVSRLYWWTVEYGLIGELNNPRIYGAGLLSSVNEGKLCLTDAVAKIPFDMETCIRTRYDVTKPQPQLFVCENFEQLIVAVRKLSERMAYKLGGTEGLERALDSGRVATYVYSSGLEVSGVISEVIKSTDGSAIYAGTTGPTALAFAAKELDGHNKTHHANGFGSPIGLLQGTDKPLEFWSDDELLASGIIVDHVADLFFRSGIRVRGVVKQITRLHGQIALISFIECTVTYLDNVLFEPTMDTFDMAVGERITSVYAGAADPEGHFADEPIGEQKLSIVVGQSSHLNELYKQIRALRSHPTVHEDLEIQVNQIIESLDRDYPMDWLSRLELLEVVREHGTVHPALEDKLVNALYTLSSKHAELHEVIHSGLELLNLSVKDMMLSRLSSGMEVGPMSFTDSLCGVARPS